MLEIPGKLKQMGGVNASDQGETLWQHGVSERQPDSAGRQRRGQPAHGSGGHGADGHGQRGHMAACQHQADGGEVISMQPASGQGQDPGNWRIFLEFNNWKNGNSKPYIKGSK